jgi:predicted SAM-dependent methyltransferase
MFAERYFVGKALDIGAGPDGLSRQLGIWPLLTSVTEWDKADGDAQELKGVPDNSYDLVYSSHCLEHMRDDGAAIHRWAQVLKPGGHMVIVVPDFEMYERGEWPSRKNPDHKHRFTFAHCAYLLLECVREVEEIKVERLTEHFDPSLPSHVDQTQGLAECAIEIIVRKSE